jgi:hypothetical protein
MISALSCCFPSLRRTPLSEKARATQAPPPDTFSEKTPLLTHVQPALIPPMSPGPRFPGLKPSDFARRLDKSVIRATDSELPDDVFEKKWAAAEKMSPQKLMRAFPAAFHLDLKQIDPSKVPGGESVGFGDAHLNNFGFLHLQGKTLFAYNDLDDSGICPTAFDAVRYFTIARLFLEHRKDFELLLDRYLKAVKDPNKGVEVDDRLAPNWKKLHKKGLEEITTADGAHLDFKHTALEPIPAEQRDAIFEALRTQAGGQFTPVDVGSKERDHGGSAGMRRYEVLVDGPQGRTLIELKEAQPVGTELGRHTHVLPMDERLPVLKQTFWGMDPPDNYLYVKTLGSRFLLRDKLTEEKVDVRELSHKKADRLLEVQTSELARVHAAGWAGVTKEEMRTWIDRTSETLAKRWSTVFADN